MSEMEGYGNFTNPRLVYNLGHAAFEFMESRWGKEGIRQFMFALRKSVIGGGDNAYEEAFKLTPEEFDQQFEKYLKDRFKPFRDKERPADYGRNLAPNPEKGRYSNALTAEVSPSGDLIAIVTGNRNDREYDIVLVSAKDGQVVRNLTSGFDQDMGFENISIPGTRWNTVPWLSWSPGGDRLAYAVRMGKNKGIIVQNVVSRKVEHRVDLPTVNEPESPSIAPNGRVIAFSALQDAVGDIYTVDLETKELKNLTNDAFFDYAPVYSPDGKYIVYLARVSGNEKLFKLDLATGKKTQVTFGTHDDAAARFLNDSTIVFASTALDPAVSVDPAVAKNGNIYNIWTLNLENGELRQYTDSLGGNVMPVPVRADAKSDRIAFITYYKGEYGLLPAGPEQADQVGRDRRLRRPGPIIDFQAPLSHTVVAQNKKKKGMFEKLFIEGRPPVNVGVTSNGDVFGGTEISFADVLGDQRFSFVAASISQYRTFGGTYLNLSRRLQWAVQGFSQKTFFYGQNMYFYDPIYSPIIDRDLAQATRSVYGGNAFGIWPLDAYRRLEFSGGVMRYSESYNDPGLQEVADDYQQQLYGRELFNNGTIVPFGLTFIQETTIFREFGPLAGNTMRIGYEYAPEIGNTLQRQTIDADLRYYLRLGGTALLALRGRGFKSSGSYPDYLYFGGNSEMRGYEYLEFIGQNVLFGNAELRFPLIEAMLTPVGVIGGVRGVAVLQRRRRVVQRQRLQVHERQHRGVPADHRRRARRNRDDPRADRLAADPGQRLPPAGLAGLVRHRPRDLRARLPHPLRLGVADDVQQGVGGRPVRGAGRKRGVPQVAVLGVDWLRLLARIVHAGFGIQRVTLGPESPRAALP